jgi:hypothetical protein
MPHYADPFLRKQVNEDKKKRRDSARRKITTGDTRSISSRDSHSGAKVYLVY